MKLPFINESIFKLHKNTVKRLESSLCVCVYIYIYIYVDTHKHTQVNIIKNITTLITKRNSY